MVYSEDWTENLTKSIKKIFPILPSYKLNCVEIGSFEGRGSNIIVENLCRHSDSRLFCIDHWEDTYFQGEKSNFDSITTGQWQRFVENTGGNGKIIPMRGISDSQIPFLEDKSINFAYIDGDHTAEQVYKDGVNILPKMKSGGIIVFDDYLFSKDDIVTRHGIDRFIKDYKEKISVISIDYQVIVNVL